MIVCSCNVLTDQDVRSAVKAGRPHSTGQVYGRLGCSPKCGRCALIIRRINRVLLIRISEVRAPGTWHAGTTSRYLTAMFALIAGPLVFGIALRLGGQAQAPVTARLSVGYVDPYRSIGWASKPLCSIAPWRSSAADSNSAM